MKRILITGGAGFIGSFLTERLLKQGHEVFVLDDLSTGSMDNIAHLEGDPHFHLVIDSILNREIIARLVDRADDVYHLAAAVGVRYVVEHQLRALRTNVLGTEHVLEMANKKKKRVLIASSSEVYGKKEESPFREETDCVQGATSIGRWGYAASKALDEFLGLAYWKEERLPVVIARFFNTVGPRQSSAYGMVIPTFVQQALKGEPITIYGTGEQTRCFAHVEDVTDVIIALMSETKAFGQVFNVGNPEEVSMNTLATMIKEMTNSPSEIVHIPYAQTYHSDFEDMMRRVPDISKIESLLGFHPKYRLRDILEDVIMYQREKGDRKHLSGNSAPHLSLRGRSEATDEAISCH